MAHLNSFQKGRHTKVKIYFRRCRDAKLAAKHEGNLIFCNLQNKQFAGTINYHKLQYFPPGSNYKQLHYDEETVFLGYVFRFHRMIEIIDYSFSNSTSTFWRLN